MDDHRRRQYLDAMGILTWTHRDRPVESIEPESVEPDRTLSAEARVSEVSIKAVSPPSEPVVRAAVDEPPPWLAEVPPPDDERAPTLNDDDLFLSESEGKPRVVNSVATLDWKGLEQRVATCESCDLHETRTQTVFGVGRREADLMVIGEAPGADEDRQGEPFVGRAGQLLNAMLLAIGLQREDVYIANVLKCRPPDNRDPRPEESRQCEPFLKRQLALVKPRVVLAVGRVAAQNLLQTADPVGRMRGRSFAYDEVPLVVTYHPAYLLRSPEQKSKAWDDLQRVADLLRR